MSTSAPDESVKQEDARTELARLVAALRELHVVEEYDTPTSMFARTAWGCSTCETHGDCPTLLVLGGLTAEEALRV